MKTGRVIVAGIVGGIVMFVWGAVAHMALDLNSGMKSVPNDAVVPALGAALPGDGFYFFPAMPEQDTKETRDAWMAKAKSGPSGMIIYHARLDEVMGARHFIVEFVSGLGAALIGAAVIGAIGGTMMRRMGIGMALGVFAWLSVDVSYWNWHGYPTVMLRDTLIEQGAGWAIAGLVMGLVIGKKTGT